MDRTISFFDDVPREAIPYGVESRIVYRPNTKTEDSLSDSEKAKLAQALLREPELISEFDFAIPGQSTQDIVTTMADCGFLTGVVIRNGRPIPVPLIMAHNVWREGK